MAVVDLVVALLLALGAVARITRFLTSDTLAGPLRAWIIARTHPDAPLATLISCPWCLSFWVALVVVPVAYVGAGHAWYLIPAAVLAVSYAYSLTAQTLDH